MLKKHLVARVVRRGASVTKTSTGKSTPTNVRGRHLRSLSNHLEHVSATQRPDCRDPGIQLLQSQNKNPSWTLACTVPRKVGRYPDYLACADPKLLHKSLGYIQRVTATVLLPRRML